MGRSSRFLCVLCFLAATPALGQHAQTLMPAPVGLRAPAMPVARPIVRPNVGMGYVRPTLGSRTVRPAPFYVRPTLGSRAVRPLRGYTRPTLGVRAAPRPIIRSVRDRDGRGRSARGGLDGAGLGLSLADDLAIPGMGGGGYDEQRVVPELGPVPCVKPQIIKIGAGVRRHVKTRVVYGPATCTP